MPTQRRQKLLVFAVGNARQIVERQRDRRAEQKRR
jgi:hypothetical protein